MSVNRQHKILHHIRQLNTNNAFSEQFKNILFFMRIIFVCTKGYLTCFAAQSFIVKQQFESLRIEYEYMNSKLKVKSSFALFRNFRLWTKVNLYILTVYLFYQICFLISWKYLPRKYVINDLQSRRFLTISTN